MKMAARWRPFESHGRVVATPALWLSADRPISLRPAWAASAKQADGSRGCNPCSASSLHALAGLALDPCHAARREIGRRPQPRLLLQMSKAISEHLKVTPERSPSFQPAMAKTLPPTFQTSAPPHWTTWVVARQARRRSRCTRPASSAPASRLVRQLLRPRSASAGSSAGRSRP